MTNFKNGDKVYWDNTSGRYIGQDPYDPYQSYVIDINSCEVGTITTNLLSSEPPMTLRELNGKALFELWENVWAEVLDARNPITWADYANSPDTKEAYMRLAQKLNYTAGDENHVQN